MKTKLVLLLLLGVWWGKCFAQNDTVKVVMLVCDTVYIPQLHFMSEAQVDSSFFYEKLTSFKFAFAQFGASENHVSYVWWQYGYEVYKFVPQHFNHNDEQVPDTYELIQRLDENKQPLKKSIIVWQSLQIK